MRKSIQQKIGVIGRYGANINDCDGQTVKTRNLVHLLETQENISVFKADTYYFKKNNLKLLLDSVWCVLTCRHIFLLVSVNGMNLYLRALYYINKLFHRHIYHYIIGSELLDMVAKNKRLVKYLNALEANWFEYESGTQFLREQGVSNVETVPNFKMITPVETANDYEPADGVYRFCTFSRVMEEKGITDAIEAVKKINSGYKCVKVTLDVYGPVAPQYEKTFAELVKEHEDCVTYKGVADSAQSVSILKQYYALIFPTRWAGEGVPGTVIDAFASGIPVIATDWNANGELIRNYEQGLLYPNDQVQNLEEAIRWALQNETAMNRMRVESRKEFAKFLPETILAKILVEIEKKDT